MTATTENPVTTTTAEMTTDIPATSAKAPAEALALTDVLDSTVPLSEGAGENPVCYARLYPHGIQHHAKYQRGKAQSKKDQSSQTQEDQTQAEPTALLQLSTSPEIVIYGFSGEKACLDYCLNMAKNEFEYMMRLLAGCRVTYAFTVAESKQSLWNKSQDKPSAQNTKDLVVSFFASTVAQSAPRKKQCYLDLSSYALSHIRVAAAKWNFMVLRAYLSACRNPASSWPDITSNTRAVEHWFVNFKNSTDFSLADELPAQKSKQELALMIELKLTDTLDKLSQALD